MKFRYIDVLESICTGTAPSNQTYVNIKLAICIYLYANIFPQVKTIMRNSWNQLPQGSIRSSGTERDVFEYICTVTALFKLT